MTTLLGLLRAALDDAVPSPEYPTMCDPATVEITQVFPATSRIRWFPLPAKTDCHARLWKCLQAH